MLISLLIAGCSDVVKAAAVITELRQRDPDWNVRLVASGRADDPRLPVSGFVELGIARPDAYLNIEHTDALTEITGLLAALKNEFETARPDALLVFGDSSTTLAGALAASQLRIPVGHVGAGLRSFDRRMPREVNRVLADAVCDWLFTSEREADVNLHAEGLRDQKIHFVGSTTIDTLIRLRPIARQMHVGESIGLVNPYVVVALSEPENMDHAAQRRSIAYGLITLADEFDVAWSLSPHVSERLLSPDVSDVLEGHKRLRMLPAMGYLEFLSLLQDSAAVLTDSGTIQEEALMIGRPCVTLSRYTTHPVTLAHGGNRLAGSDPHLAARYIREAIHDRAGYAPWPESWDGRAASRIVDVLEKDLAGSDKRFRQEVPPAASDGGFAQEVPTSGSDGGFRDKVPASGSDGGFRSQVLKS